ncbi:SCO family protein [bacterium]|nr:SCO family protein [bacterium]
MKHLKWILAVPVVVFFFVWLGHKKNSQTQKLLPRLIEIPEFHLRTQEGFPFEKKNFLGRVTLVNFIFTNCPTVCPLLTQKMKEVVAMISNPEIQFVSISVDPENDTPEVLKKYGERFGADWSKWTFLTGPLDQISDIVVKGFKVVFVRDSKDLLDITHGEYFVLVDKTGYIRAYRMISDESSKKDLVNLLQSLAKE